MRFDLNVIVLKGHVLLPFNEIKIDLNVSLDIIESAKLFDDSKVLVVTDIDDLEETIDIDKLPDVGTIVKIKNKV